MNPILTITQMREVDRTAIGNDSSIGYRYMQKAGMGLYQAAREMIPDTASGEIAIVCGKGNNGGDGYVAGRLLINDGYRVVCYSLVPPENLGGECLLAYRDYTAGKFPVVIIDDIADFPHPSRFCLIIDALLGTGLKGNPHGLHALMIETINNSAIPVLAVDTPSGLDNDTGLPGFPCIRAATTVAMGYSKPGLHFFPGKSFTGNLIVEELSYPDDLIANIDPVMFLPAISDFRKMLPRRRPDGSKFDHGLALFVGGSPGMTGSVTLMAEAAQRCGCGMVHCAVSRAIADVLSVKLTEPVLHLLPGTADGTLDVSATGPLLNLAERMQALCIGPGLSHGTATTQLVRDIISQCPLPTILDADGINAFKDAADELVNHAGDLCITPHTGEWERLFGPLPSDPCGRAALISSTARRFHLTILLKGNPTLVASPKGVVTLLPYGNSSLAKAGTGDVLSGCITSFTAQGIPVTDAALLGAYIHGCAGELASRDCTEYAVTAHTVIDYIAQSVRSLL
ncbi:MAG: NAD(P)H-hydrate dehydratase [Chitinispirillaceae bacterium]|nr:NAD(P)H-hydrate dehydratase [Chitinispirillaceae bacterium]